MILRFRNVEEIEEIQPAINEAMEEGINIPEKKPTPPDSIFSKAIGGWYDIVVAMYHDQGHIPLKVEGFTLLSKHSIKFKDWFEKDMMKLYNLTPPEDINNTEQFVIYRPNFYKGVSIVTVLVFLGFLIMTIVVADNRPDLYLFWVVCLVFSVISAIHTCTYKYTIENRKIRYKWLFGKEKVIAFSEIDKITLEGSPNSECGMIYKKGVKKPFMKIRMIDKNANRFRYLNIK